MDKVLKLGIKAFKIKDYETAMRILLPIAKQGHPEAQCIIGNLYDLGFGQPVDKEKAKHWYLKSSEQGYGVASNNLGTMFYMEGNPEKANEWYEKARKQGFLHSPRNFK